MAAALVFAFVAAVAFAFRPDRQDGPGGASTGDQARDIQASAAALPKCAEVFAPGNVIDQAKAEAGCLDPSGNVQVVGSHRCQDGRHLWQVDAVTGAKAGYGFGGEKYIAGEKGYSKAYDSCMS